MRYERSLCHAPADAAGHRTSFDGTRKSNDHFVTPPLWTSLGRDGLIHDQFVTPIAITLSRGSPKPTISLSRIPIVKNL
jgi:hypothetical protein